MFRGSELLRLLTGVLMLGLLFVLFNRLRDPSVWTWLVPNASSARPSDKADGAKVMPAADAAKATSDATRTIPITVGQETTKTQSESPPPRDAAKGPTDQDPDEAQEAAMEFQAITDGTLELQREEMVPYDRMVRWVQDQSFDTLLRRSRTDLAFTHLYQSPAKYRGQIVALDLNVRQILDAGKDESGVHLWEVRGWTTESKAWLYWAIVLDLPNGMPTGPDVYEKAEFVGYFFKLQGYHEAGAKPNAPRLKAPLLIGRLEWKPVVAAPSDDKTSEFTWGLALLTILGAAVGLRFVYRALRQKPRAKAVHVLDRTAGTTVPIETWLDRVNHAGDDGENGLTGTDEPCNDKRHAGDGQPREAGPLPEQLDEE
jgi:hypothetical protein